MARYICGLIVTPGGAIDGGVYTAEEWNTATFSPAAEVLSMFPLSCSVKGYDFLGTGRPISDREKRQAILRDYAHEWEFISSATAHISYGEFAIVYEFFESAGRRYGLLREFRENGIC